MNIYQLLGEKEVSNDYLAEKLRESYNRYKEYVEENTPLWRKEGVEMRNKREEQGISQRYLGELVGVSSQTIARMELNEKFLSEHGILKDSDKANELSTTYFNGCELSNCLNKKITIENIPYTLISRNSNANGHKTYYLFIKSE